MKYTNTTTLRDREFYSRNAESFGRAALKFTDQGLSDLAGWYAARAASYAICAMKSK